MLKSDEREFIQYCLENYKAPFFSKEEFSNDLNSTVVLKKMFRRYVQKKVINERLALNKIITLINVFGVKTANIILFFKIDEEFYPILKAFLMFINSYVENEFTRGIEPDRQILQLLRDM